MSILVSSIVGVFIELLDDWTAEWAIIASNCLPVYSRGPWDAHPSFGGISLTLAKILPPPCDFLDLPLFTKMITKAWGTQYVYFGDTLGTISIIIDFHQLKETW